MELDQIFRVGLVEAMANMRQLLGLVAQIVVIGIVLAAREGFVPLQDSDSNAGVAPAPARAPSFPLPCASRPALSGG